jgi:hypothetical protein
MHQATKGLVGNGLEVRMEVEVHNTPAWAVVGRTKLLFTFQIENLSNESSSSKQSFELKLFMIPLAIGVATPPHLTIDYCFVRNPEIFSPAAEISGRENVQVLGPSKYVIASPCSGCYKSTSQDLSSSSSSGEMITSSSVRSSIFTARTICNVHS